MEIIPYASRTGTKQNLESLRCMEWRLLVSATGRMRTEGFEHYAIENGAWTAHQQQRPFDDDLFVSALRTLGKDADWVNIPDIVEGGLRSLEFSLSWMSRVLDATQLALLCVQDGMTPADVRGVLGPRVGIFIGGSTAWKLSTLEQWCALARELSVWCHVGRVNSALRIRKCQAAGATSFDGSNASRFRKNHPKLNEAIRQQTLDLDWK